MTAVPLRFRRFVAVHGAAVAVAMVSVLAAGPVTAQQGDVFPGGDTIVTPAPSPADSGPAPGRPGAETPTASLFAAVFANDLPAVQAAVTAGADIDARNRWGLSAIDIAVDKGFYQIAHFLLSIRNTSPDAAADRPASRTASGAAAAALQAGPRSPAAPPPAVPRRGQRGTETAGPKAASADESRYAWPRDEPNPFDPAHPAPGAALTVPGGIRVP